MANAAMLEKLSSVRARVQNDSRVSLSEFARGREWRLKLAGDDFMELQEHGDRVAWIISENGMRDVVDYITELEELLEQSSIQAMFESRRNRENWVSGDALEEDALAYYRAKEDELMKVASGD